MMLQMKICMAQWDNTNRTNNFTSGRKNCMRNGVYCGPAPIGYDKQGKMKKCRIKFGEDTIDEETFNLTMEKLKDDLQGIDLQLT